MRMVVVRVMVVIVRVMHIRRVVVVVGEPGMVMEMRMLADERRIVGMLVVTVVVAMHVVVLDRLVDVGMAVLLGEMQRHADGEQRRRRDRPAGDRAAAGSDGDRSAEE